MEILSLPCLYPVSSDFSLGAEYIPGALPGAAAAPSLNSSSAHLSGYAAAFGPDQAFLMLPLLPRWVFTACLLLINPRVFPDFQASERLEFLLSGIMFVCCRPPLGYQHGGVRDLVLFMFEEKVKK